MTTIDDESLARKFEKLFAPLNAYISKNYPRLGMRLEKLQEDLKLLDYSDSVEVGGYEQYRYDNPSPDVVPRRLKDHLALFRHLFPLAIFILHNPKELLDLSTDEKDALDKRVEELAADKNAKPPAEKQELWLTIGLVFKRFEEEFANQATVMITTFFSSAKRKRLYEPLEPLSCTEIQPKGQFILRDCKEWNSLAIPYKIPGCVIEAGIHRQRDLLSRLWQILPDLDAKRNGGDSTSMDFTGCCPVDEGFFRAILEKHGHLLHSSFLRSESNPTKHFDLQSENFTVREIFNRFLEPSLLMPIFKSETTSQLPLQLDRKHMPDCWYMGYKESVEAIARFEKDEILTLAPSLELNRNDFSKMFASIPGMLQALELEGSEDENQSLLAPLLRPLQAWFFKVWSFFSGTPAVDD